MRMRECYTNLLRRGARCYAAISMLPFLIVLFFGFLGLLALQVLVRFLKQSALGIDEPVQLPAMTVWSMALAAVALNLFAYDTGFGIGYGLFGMCAFLAIVLLFPPAQRGWEVWFLTVVGMTACVFFGWRANEFVQIVNAVTAIACAGALLMLRGIGTVRWSGLWLIKMKVGFVARLFHRFSTLGAIGRSAPSAHGRTALHVLKTIGITLIVLLFFSWLLSLADPVFDALVRDVREQALGRTILSGLLLVALLFLISINVPKKWQEKVPQLTRVSVWEVGVPALSVVLLFGLFLMVQARYLFGSHVDFHALDITYADYVRRGFVELLVASFFGSLLSYVIILKQHALTKAAHIVSLRWMNGVLLVELVLLLLSAAKRDWMYIDMYGLTRVRIIGALFLFWILAIIVLMLVLTMMHRMTERTLIGGTAIASALVVLLLNAVNIDRMVAMQTPPRGERPDIVYSSRLSMDAADGWQIILAEAGARYAALRTQTEFSDQEKILLADAKIALSQLENIILRVDVIRPWQEWNGSRVHAKGVLERAFTDRSLDQVQCVLRGIRTLQRITKTDLIVQESDRLFGNEAPFLFEDFAYQPESLSDISLALSTGADTLPVCDGSDAR